MTEPTIRRAFADLSVGQVHHASCGDPNAPAVLFLHQTPRSWAEYREVLPRVGRRYRAIAMDTVGFGDSAAAPWPPSIERWTQVHPDFAQDIRDNRPEPLICQEIYPWLDQIALPLVIQSLGGGRPGPELAELDGNVTCHYRTIPLLYARESDRVVEVLETVAGQKDLRRVLRDWDPVKLMVYQNKGRKARALFDRTHLPLREQILRNTLKREGLWLR